MPTLEHGRLFTIDGGVFRAKYSEEDERFELWTYNGLSGVVARTGFEIGEDGMLWHRIYDVEAGENILFPSGYSIDDLEEVEDADEWAQPPANQSFDNGQYFDDNPW